MPAKGYRKKPEDSTDYLKRRLEMLEKNSALCSLTFELVSKFFENANQAEVAKFISTEANAWKARKALRETEERNFVIEQHSL